MKETDIELGPLSPKPKVNGPSNESEFVDHP